MTKTKLFHWNKHFPAGLGGQLCGDYFPSTKLFAKEEKKVFISDLIFFKDYILYNVIKQTPNSWFIGQLQKTNRPTTQEKP